MKRTLIANEVGRQMWLQPDVHGKKGMHHVVEQFNDCNVLAENELLRHADVLNNTKTVLHEGEKIEYWFRIPNLPLYKEFRRLHPDIIEMIESPDESIRMKGAQRMAILQPRWVIKKR